MRSHLIGGRRIRYVLLENSTRCLCFAHRSYIDKLATIFAGCEHNNTVGEGINGVVFTEANVQAGVVGGAALTLDDCAGFSKLTAKNFHAESLAFRLAAVLRTTYAFFMCHLRKKFKRVKRLFL